MNSILAHWISAYLIYGDRSGWFVQCIRFPQIYFTESCSASKELLRKEVGTKFTQLKINLSQTNWLVFVVFLMYNFHLSLTALYYFVG